MADRPRLYILDTNVLMHDPTALFRFAEHDIFLPMIVLEELDRAKKGLSEVSRNVRQVSRFIGEMMDQADSLDDGLALTEPDGVQLEAGSGRLFFQTTAFDNDAGLIGDRSLADNEILLAALSLEQRWPNHSIILVSKDINLRIKAAIHGITAEDYYNDRVLDDLSLLYSGLHVLDNRFWQERDTRDSWTERDRTFYRITPAPDEEWHPNQCIKINDDNGLEAIVRRVEKETLVLEVARDYRNSRHGVWGIHARNTEQNFALNLLLDPDIDFVTILGTAGTGKTLLTLAAGLAQTLDDKLYREIIMTRATVSVGEEIGFLPGTEEEKMTPWMGALTDNLEVLTEGDEAESDWGRAVTNELISARVKVRAMNFMRGRTFLNRYLIIDEAQNLTPKQMKTLITRAGPGTKIVCLGNIEQIDTPYLTETSSGLTYAVDRFKNWPHAGHITLKRGERSRLADFAAVNL